LASDVLRKLVLITLAAILAIGVLIGVGYVQMQRVFDGADVANRNAVPSLAVLADMQRDFLRVHNALARHVAADGGGKDAEEAEINIARASLQSDFKSYEVDGCVGQTCVDSPLDGDYLQRERALWERYSPLIDTVVLTSRRGATGLNAAHDLLSATNDLASNMLDLINGHVNSNMVAAREASAGARRIKNEVLVWQAALGLAMVIGLALINYMMLRGLVGELKKLNSQLGGEPADAMRAAQQLAAGDLEINLRLRDHDNRSVMASMQSIVETMNRLADRADGIGRGELDAEVVLASRKDRLGLAINRMVGLLRTSRSEERRRNWLKDGYADLSEALSRDMLAPQIAETALNLIGRNLGAGRGVVYVLAPGGKQLDLLASYIYSEHDRFGAHFRLGEGAIGQVARDHKPIELQIDGDDIAQIVTGTAELAPRYTYTYPFLHEKALLGVLELATVNALDTVQTEYLQSACDTLAASLYLAQQRARVREMLDIAKESERQMREQSFALKESNLRLEEQQQQLQQQTEELQQANAQMEEQQQQMQQQAEELQQSYSQLEETQARLEQQNRDLEQAGRYKSEFLANMSHELRTPLNSIILLSKMLGQGDQTQTAAQAQEWAQVIHRSGRELLKLIDDVLDLAKVEAGRLDLHLAPMATEQLCSELRALFGPIAQEKGLSFNIDDGLQATLMTDSQKLGQILRNLLSNAMKFCKQGEVSLKLERIPDQDPALPLRLTVRDTGIGIPAEKQSVIFEAFTQADGSTSREYGGTGLGLTISQRMAHLMGGRIELQSVPGEGSAFTVCLPDQQAAGRSPAAKERVNEPVHEPVQDDRYGLRPGDRTVLLIDDDVTFGEALIALNRSKGYKTLIAGDGAQGLALARQYRPSGILLDLGLPDMEGAQLLHQLKTDPRLSEIPVHIVSGRGRDESLIQGGAIGFSQKPVNDDALLSAQAALMVHVNKAGKAGAQRGVLLLEGESLHRDALQDALPAGRLTVCALDDPIEPQLAGAAPALAVIDLSGRGVERALALSAQLRETWPKLPLVYCTDQPVPADEEGELRRFSDSLILQSSQSRQRLLANVERFLNEVPEAPSKPAAKGSQRLSGRRVLVTDDDPRNLFVIVAALEKNGAKVSTAVNGRKALDYLKANDVDLVLMDIMMPEMDGYQALTELRSQPRWAKLPVVVLSAKALPADRARMLAAGAQDFLAKPVDYEALIDTAQRWSQEPPA
jgi:hypothetical protein